jgi:hypothetical protein
MKFDQLEMCRAQFARSPEDVGWNPYFPKVVNTACRAQRRDGFARKAQMPSEGHCQIRDPGLMTHGVGVADLG